MNSLYNISIYGYALILQLASLFNQKASQFVNGRKGWYNQLKNLKSDGRKVYWFHCSSLGEFEQGRPLMEQLKASNSDIFLVVSFFSPSGYEIRKNYKLADYTCYLPIDTPKNAKKFVHELQPDYVFFIKYEFWFNYINEISRKKIPLYNISGIFRNSQHFFKTYGSWFRKQLSKFNWFYLQNEESVDLLNSIGIKSCSVSGDARFDRVKDTVAENRRIPVIEKFTKDSLTIFGGSCWDKEEAFLGELLKANKRIKLVLAPHNVKEDNIQKIIKNLPEDAARYSKLSEYDTISQRILIIDGIGILSHAYRYADISLIGGGFNDGLHNVLEAVSWGSPVLFGPKHQNFPESFELMEIGAGKKITTAQEFLSEINNWIEHPEQLKTASDIAKNYASNKTGVTDRIFKHLTTHFSHQI